jgi:hypothetical protein
LELENKEAENKEEAGMDYLRMICLYDNRLKEFFGGFIMVVFQTNNFSVLLGEVP